MDDAIIDQGLQIIRRLWEAGLARRDIKPANLLVRDGELYLIDVFFTEVRPGPWRQGVDLANMLLVLALRSHPEHVYQRALRQFTVEEISEALSATRGLTMPSQLRRMLRAQGQDCTPSSCSFCPSHPGPSPSSASASGALGSPLPCWLARSFAVGFVVSNLNGLGLIPS